MGNDLFGPPRCRCESCSKPDAPGKTYSRQFLHACEVRWVAGLPNHRARGDYLGLVEQERGKNAAERLRADVWKAMKA
ncbi:MAG TPA: hypothetical protein VN667_17970 [Burkholderiales bacterium]|nr:hypothetical protein [Burkholderiales bacterium]